MTHYLKTWPDPFQKVRSGIKRAEFRKNDRTEKYKVNDTLVLQEFQPYSPDTTKRVGVFTGEEISVKVLDITEGFGIPEGYVMMSIELS